MTSPYQIILFSYICKFYFTLRFLDAGHRQQGKFSCSGFQLLVSKNYSNPSYNVLLCRRIEVYDSLCVHRQAYISGIQAVIIHVASRVSRGNFGGIVGDIVDFRLISILAKWSDSCMAL